MCQEAARGAAELVALAHTAHAFTNTADFTLRCGVCLVMTLQTLIPKPWRLSRAAHAFANAADSRCAVASARRPPRGRNSGGVSQKAP